MNRFLGATVAATTIAGALIWTYFEYSGTEYVCDKCGEQYKPTVWQWINAMHFPTSRYMRCPVCFRNGWHRRVRVPDTKDFFD